MHFSQRCFGSHLKDWDCLWRYAIPCVPLASVFLLLPTYRRIVKQRPPDGETPAYFWLHVAIITALVACQLVFAALGDRFDPRHLVHAFQVISYATVGLSLCVLSRRVREPHPTLQLIFFLTIILKTLQLVVEAIEGVFFYGNYVEAGLLMAEVGLLATSKPRAHKTENPEEQSTFFSRLFFCWMNRLVSTGAKRPLEAEDLYPLADKACCAQLYGEFSEEWARQKKKQAEKDEKSGTKEAASLVWPFVRMQKSLIIAISAARFVADIVHYLNPLLLKQLIDYVSLSGEQPLSFGVGIALIMFLSAESRSMLQNFQIRGMFKLSVYYQSILTKMIFQKVLAISPSARAHHTAGEILNHAAVDVELITHSIPYLQNMWSVPFQVTLAMIMLSITLGPAALAGIAIMSLFIPLNFFTSRYIKRSQMAQMKVKDDRIKLSNELLNGIKVVKLYAWEESFEAKINRLRTEEVRLLRNVCVFSRIVDIVNAASPFLVAIASFTTFVLLNEPNSLTPSVAFVALTIFNQLRQPMRMVANLINTLVQAMVSNKRLKQFMNEEEMHRNVEYSLGSAVVLREASLNWLGAEFPPVLKQLTATVRTHQLVAIVGSVGSGKSSLLASLLDEMNLLEGRIKVGGTMAFVPQQSWIFNRSVKENILFGSHYDPIVYSQIVKACQLEADFACFQSGDETLVGENGITLSGGQKARISLARAVYQDREIYLLDDPLSAVDAHVGSAIYQHVVGPQGILKHKTRLLVTHNLQYTKDVDVIYVIEDGMIVERGTFDELKSMGGAFERLYVEFVSKQKEKEVTGEEELVGEKATIDDEDATAAAAEVALKKKTSLDVPKDDETTSVDKVSENNNAINIERVQLGRVKRSVYGLYFATMGYLNSVGFFVFFILHFASVALRSLWLSDWSNQNALARKQQLDNSTTSLVVVLPTQIRLAVYAGFGAIEIALLCCSFSLLTIGTLKASYGLHAPLIRALLRAPIAFFDVTPIGRIINRLSRDLDTIDKLQDSLRMFTQNVLNVCMVLMLVSISTPIFLVVAGPLILVYYLIMSYFVPTARQIKRIESATRSPILSTMSETIHGASSIRAFRKAESMGDALSLKVDNFAQCKYLTAMANRWLATRLELLGNTTVLFASLSATLSTRFFGLTPGMAGLSVSYALSITEVLNMAVRMMSDLETNIVSVERVKEYQGIEQEAEWDNGKGGVADEWPDKGEIEFCNYAMKYREHLPKVLKNINLKIEGGEKIGIIGRTGSGKSSLTLALYRLIEAFEGHVKIDGIRTDHLGLHQLRKRMIIIPQEPVVFSGSLRFNLDPFDQHTDDEIWKALDICQLKGFAASDSQALDRPIAEGGKNMSMGERQLLCLCRAVLRGGRIVVLDEATASVDALTDGIVQRAVSTHFPAATTLAIAHRLDTIAHSDRILVLDDGNVAEFDTPQNLLRDPNSLYSRLLEKANQQ